jgi:hypothetical protein
VLLNVPLMFWTGFAIQFVVHRLSVNCASAILRYLSLLRLAIEFRDIPWTSPPPRSEDMSQVNAQISNSTFGEPIGGVSVQADFIPNLFFCLGFAFVFGWGVFTVFFSPQRRTLLRFASIGVCLERMLVFSIRMAASFRQDVRESWGLSEYQQVALSIGPYLFVHMWILVSRLTRAYQRVSCLNSGAVVLDFVHCSSSY